MRPLDLLHYIYALFHSPTYRRRYSSQLCVDFPRVLIPRDVGLFRKLSQLGEQLVAAHLDDSDDGDADFDADVTFTGTRPRLVDAGHPQHADERVHIGGDAWFHPVSTAAWEFRVGAHQVLHKWLKGRRRTMLDDEAVRTYQRMAASVLLTQRIMRRVDLSIEQHGPWPAAFI